MHEFEKYPVWQRTLASQDDQFESKREKLRICYFEFRNCVKHLVSEIAGLLPELTVHDITHLDALWGVAGHIAGDDCVLNPAEAFVLGGAILLHDSAHVLAAFPGRLDEIKTKVEWKDLIAQQFNGNEPVSGSSQEKYALFQILRQLHASQARRLPQIPFFLPNDSAPQYLIQNFEIRESFGALIGEIAESHHWPADRVEEEFKRRILNAPAFLPAEWTVDALKIAFLLRTSDAAHINGERAPWFLFALRRPQGVSEQHWRFQSKLGHLTRNDRNELRITSNSPFSITQRNAWWLAFDAAQMIHRELRDAFVILRANGRDPFQAHGVADITSPVSFANGVMTENWEPVDVQPAIRDVAKIIENFGGVKLYGDKPQLALRELLQNAADAVRALRALIPNRANEGEIEVALTLEGEQIWLHVTDLGVGMSRHVLTNVLPDFGSSLWNSDLVRTELPGLASTGFKSIGQFGIGFYSVFMLGDHVRVISKRFKRASGDDSDEWVLEFENRLSSRPILRKPLSMSEELYKPGTKVSVAISADTLVKIMNPDDRSVEIEGLSEFLDTKLTKPSLKSSKNEGISFGQKVASLCPTLDIPVFIRLGQNPPEKVIEANDWKKLPPRDLLYRLYGSEFSRERDIDLLELTEQSGQIVGRVGLGGRNFWTCITTHQGIRSGTSSGALFGVIQGENNSTLIRSNSIPSPSHEAWRIWAHRVVANDEKLSIGKMLALHPLLPDSDFPVFQLSGNNLSMRDLCDLFASIDQIVVYFGEPSYEDDDDLSEYQFDQQFEHDENVLFCPEPVESIAKLLGLEVIDYSEKLHALFEQVWGDFELDEQDEEVGMAGTVSIVRDVTVYTKAQSTE